MGYTYGWQIKGEKWWLCYVWSVSTCALTVKHHYKSIQSSSACQKWLNISDLMGAISSRMIPPQAQGTRAHWKVWWVRKRCKSYASVFTVTRSQPYWTVLEWTALFTKHWWKENLSGVCCSSLQRLVESLPASAFKPFWQLMMVRHLTETLCVCFSLICHPSIRAIWTHRAASQKHPLRNRVIIHTNLCRHLFLHRSLSDYTATFSLLWLILPWDHAAYHSSVVMRTFADHCALATHQYRNRCE